MSFNTCIKIDTKEKLESFLKAIEESEKAPENKVDVKYEILRGKEAREYFKKVYKE